jgi:hypothetical protein
VLIFAARRPNNLVNESKYATPTTLQEIHKKGIVWTRKLTRNRYSFKVECIYFGFECVSVEATLELEKVYSNKRERYMQGAKFQD